MTDPEPTFQAQMVALRHTRILDAAAQVFATHGFHRTTIRDVAQAAGVADGTIYKHFANKDALLLGLLDRLHSTEMQAVERAQDDSDDLRTFVRRYFANYLALFASENQELLRVVLSEVLVNAELRELYVQRIATPTLVLMLERLLPRAARFGVSNEHMIQTLQLMSSMVLGLLMARMFNEEAAQQSWEQLPELLTELFFTGLLHAEGSS
jgi:AcrR family transcriptional regulator